MPDEYEAKGQKAAAGQYHLREAATSDMDQAGNPRGWIGKDSRSLLSMSTMRRRHFSRESPIMRGLLHVQ